eukprot:CAMPEP_0201128768 /NCGR_PEP_ID=MMETSP0850-20130426/34730_1 /ASSEMBLY_ACC=CAM_ASM_000622 /TAXON_ID=183588 /ORGANISM="Pseudo-nitzschia fraudulenta, Strain WWA7" /LENGTH=183 /DNA_ID=CAMNT_0047398051 /DNA_START=248 /DNA_END=796 /DNA_ORIENTATION=+
MATANDTIIIRSMTDENGNFQDFEVNKTVATELSGFIMDAPGICENYDDDDDNDDDDDEKESKPQEIVVPRVGGACLAKVVAFMRHYEKEPMKKLPTFLEKSTFEETITQEWYKDFLEDETRIDLFDLVGAGDFLQIEMLLDLVVLKISYSLIDKTPEEIRKIFKLPEMTEEEEQKAMEEYPW